MTLLHRESDQMCLTQDAPNAPGQLTSVPGGLTSGDELLVETDEPPDEPRERTPRPAHAYVHTSRFEKTAPPQLQRKESLLTQMIHSEAESFDEEDHRPDPVRRGLSTVSISTTSTAELTSDDALTSPGTRTSTPSPPLPPIMFHGLSSIFDKKPSHAEPIIHQEEHAAVGPTQKLSIIAPSEQTVEEGLGRKRCISFACGRKDNSKDAPKANQQDPPKATEAKPADQPKRPCALRFVCPTRSTADTSLKENKPKTHRLASPAPATRMASPPPKPTPRNHRDSDSTIRDSSPKTVRKVPSVIRSRRYSDNSDIDRSEAIRFHEFASSEEEVDDWTQEQTCHRSRLTVNDTLKVENGLRQLVEEVEEEALEDEEEELDEDGVNDDDEDLVEEEDEEGLEVEVASNGDVSDEGFQTDDEDGFANSDDESDADSDYHWWAPRNPIAATSADRFEHIRPTSRRSVSESSNGSVRSGHLPAPVTWSPEMRAKKKPHPVMVGPGTPELPDSTDFVCGTLDEDRPLEHAYLSRREQRRAARRKLTPQDIDPTFPTSDPEMDEEDEDSEHDNVDESDQHQFMHGQPDPHEESEARGRRGSKKHSPIGSPKRLHSPPPPTKRGIHRSPPPRKLFGQSPKRHRSPPPAARWRSPPPSRRTSFTRSPNGHTTGDAPAVLAARPQATIATSLPRATHMPHPGTATVAYDEDDDTAPSKDLRTRGAVDIVKGLEKKRQRRKEMLYQKRCRLAAAGREKERKPQPGKGAERMREVGMELAAYRGARRPAATTAANATATMYNGDLHMLSI